MITRRAFLISLALGGLFSLILRRGRPAGRREHPARFWETAGTRGG